MVWNNENLINELKNGGVAVMPTDTLYGIVGSALNQSAVEKIYVARKRSPEKPCIILIGDVIELEKFSIAVSEEQRKAISDNWPGPVSIILGCSEEKFSYLHRGTRTLAFRIPSNDSLRELLRETGPLVAPSANIEGMPPARNIDEAKKYFGGKADIYVDGGEISGTASRVIHLHEDGRMEILRK